MSKNASTRGVSRPNRSAPKRGQAAADLKAAEKHLRGFQTRDPRKLEDTPIHWPATFQAVGLVDATLYMSDKDDPLTRPPHLRRNDPDGRNGVWKLFEHLHGDDVIFYTGALPPGGKGMQLGDSAEFEEPSVVWWLAELDRLRCRDFEGRPFEVLPSKTKTVLWGVPSVNAIVLLPKNRSKVKPSQIGVICGGRMTITPMGIEY